MQALLVVIAVACGAESIAMLHQLHASHPTHAVLRATSRAVDSSTCPFTARALAGR